MQLMQHITKRERMHSSWTHGEGDLHENLSTQALVVWITVAWDRVSLKFSCLLNSRTYTPTLHDTLLEQTDLFLHVTHRLDFSCHVTTTYKSSVVPYTELTVQYRQLYPIGGTKISCRKLIVWMLWYSKINWLLYRCSLLAHEPGHGLKKK